MSRGTTSTRPLLALPVARTQLLLGERTMGRCDAVREQLIWGLACGVTRHMAYAECHVLLAV